MAVYFRLTILETPHYTAYIAMDVEKARAEAETYLRGNRRGKLEEGHTIAAESHRQNATRKATWS